MILLRSLYTQQWIILWEFTKANKKGCPKVTGVTGSQNSRVSFGDLGKAPEVISKRRPAVCVYGVRFAECKLQAEATDHTNRAGAVNPGGPTQFRMTSVQCKALAS